MAAVTLEGTNHAIASPCNLEFVLLFIHNCIIVNYTVIQVRCSQNGKIIILVLMVTPKMKNFVAGVIATPINAKITTYDP